MDLSNTSAQFCTKARLNKFVFRFMIWWSNVKSWFHYELNTACHKWKYTPLTQRLYATNYTFIAALWPRCEGGTNKQCFKNAYVISCLFSSPNKKSFIFLQNQNISTSAQLKSHNFNETIIVSTVYFYSPCPSPETWGDRRQVLYSWFRVDWCCGLRLRYSCWNVSYVNQGNEVFPFSNEGSWNIT